MKITDEYKKMLLNGFPNEGDNPFYLENGECYLRFDGINITNSTDQLGDMETRFLWRGKVTAILLKENVRLNTDEVLCLRGIIGSQRVFITEGEVI